MRTPPLLAGAALLFWGWQTGLLFLAIPGALILEGSRVAPWRWDLSEKDLGRLVTLSTLLLGGAIVYYLFGAGSQNYIASIMRILQWIPVAVFPLVTALAYSTDGRMDIRILSLVSRRKKNIAVSKPSRRVYMSYPYLLLTILCAGTANIRTPWFYGALSVLMVWTLWTIRPKQYPIAIWAILLAVTITAGYAGQVKLNQFQATVEKMLSNYYERSMSKAGSDPFRSKTAIGHVGMLKLSDKIVIRVSADKELEAPLLIRDAVYDSYSGTTWFARGFHMKDIQPDENRTTWNLGPALSHDMITISSYLEEGSGLLSVPVGTFSLEGLAVGKLTANTLGTITAAEGPGLVRFSAQYRPADRLSSPPGDRDTKVPGDLSKLFNDLAEDLRLREKEPPKVIRMIDGYFQQNFTYSMYQEDEGIDRPLEHFMLVTKVGHCEYFATATVMLLRSAGIPARYATGYSVSEFSPFENQYVVRGEHAHAWALAYIGSEWVNVDTTPASWLSIEEKNSSGLRVVSDLWAWAMFRFSQWRWKKTDGSSSNWLKWLLIPLVLFILWRLFFIKRVRVAGKRNGASSERPRGKGIDSEYFLLEERLGKRGIQRNIWEPVTSMIARIRKDPDLSAYAGKIETIVRLHNRYRFDPEGLSKEDRKSLRSGVTDLLGELNK